VLRPRRILLLLFAVHSGLAHTLRPTQVPTLDTRQRTPRVPNMRTRSHRAWAPRTAQLPPTLTASDCYPVPREMLCVKSWLLQARTSAQRRATDAMPGPSACTRLLLTLLTTDPDEQQTRMQHPQACPAQQGCVLHSHGRGTGRWPATCLGPSTGPSHGPQAGRKVRNGRSKAGNGLLCTHRPRNRARSIAAKHLNPTTGARLLASYSPASAAPLSIRVTLPAGHASRITGQHLSALLILRSTDQSARALLVSYLSLAEERRVRACCDTSAMQGSPARTLCPALPEQSSSAAVGTVLSRLIAH